MERIKIAVCDDSRIAVDTATAAAESILREAGLGADIARFTKPVDLLRHCERELVELVLLDIEMPGLDGIELGRALKSREPAPEIIYISNREDKVFAALHIHPFGFVRKGQFMKDMEDVLKSYAAQRKKRRRDKKIVVVTPDGQTGVAVTSIRYFEGSGTYQQMFLAGREEPIRISSRMKLLEEELAPEGFLRIHKGYLVNHAYIASIRTGEVVLEDGVSLPIRRGATQEIRSAYLALQRENGTMLF